MVGPLAELESRAGASDQNRAMWLLERQQGITATEIRELYMGRKTIAALVREKLSGKIDPPLTAAVVVWGNEREPVIAEAVRARYGIRPESRVFCAADDPRRLASPDGVGCDYDENLLVSEIKTGAGNVRVGSLLYVKKGYNIQQQWSMRVTGARRSLYAFEERVEVARNVFVPGQRTYEWVEYDEALVAELDVIADEFLAELDAERERRIAGDGPVVDDVLDTHAFNYLRYLRAEGEAKAAKESEWSAVGRLLADLPTFHQESPLARITWNRDQTVTTTKTVVDEDAARAANPDVFVALQKANESVLRANQKHAKAQAAVDEVLKEFTTVSDVSTTVRRKQPLTITSVKNKEMGK